MDLRTGAAHRRLAAAILLLPFGALAGCGSDEGSLGESLTREIGDRAVIEGTASYRERIALPPGTVFEVVLEDVSLADAPATEIARTTLTAPSSPPIHFSVPYDPARVDPRRTYAVRARILVGDQLLFTSDTAHPVLTRGAGQTVEIPLRMASGDPSAVPGDPIAISPPAAEIAPPPATGVEPASAMSGEMVYMADAALFRECRTDRRYPIAMEGDFIALQRAYMDAVAGGTPLYVTFEGTIEDRPRMEGSGTEPTVVVSRFVSVSPGRECEGGPTQTSLVNTYWKIIELDGTSMDAAEGRREPHLILRGVDGQLSYTATVGCNQMLGSFTHGPEAIRFQLGPTTLMACPPPLDEAERQMVRTLENAARWRIDGNTLELMDADGARIGLFEAVAL